MEIPIFVYAWNISLSTSHHVWCFSTWHWAAKTAWPDISLY